MVIESMRSVLIVLLAIVISLSIVPVNLSYSQEQIVEEMNIIVIDEYVYADVRVSNYMILRENMEAFFGFSDLDGLEVIFVFQSNWESSYQYFLDLNVSLLGLVDFPKTQLWVKVDDRMERSDQVISILESSFRTKLVKMGDKLVGSVDQTIFLSFLSDILPQENLTSFLNWLNPFALFNLVDIQAFYINIDNGTAVFQQYMFRTIPISENRIRLSGILATSAPYNPQEGVISTLSMRLYSGYVYETPENVSFQYDPNEDFYEITIENFDNVPPPSQFIIGVYRSTPIFLFHRYFNTSVFNIGGYVEVVLNVTVPETSPSIFNLTIQEVNWWEGVGELVEGDVNQTIDALGSGETELISYVVRIDSDELLDVYIPPAIASLSFIGGKNVTVYSNDYYIHLNRDAPLLVVEIIPTSNSIEVGRDYEFVAKISNVGSSNAENVVFSDFLIGSLEPNRVIRVNESILLFDESAFSSALSVEADYRYEDEEYKVRSMSVSLSPIRSVYFKYEITGWIASSEINESAVTYSIVLENNGPRPLRDVAIYIRLFSEVGFEVSEDYAYNGTHIIIELDVLDNEDPYSIQVNVTYPGLVVTLRPQVWFYVYSDLAFSLDIDYFYNVLNIEVNGYDAILIKEKPEEFTIEFINNGPIPVYNISMAWTRNVEEVVLLPEEYIAPQLSPGSVEVVSVNLTALETGEIEMPSARFTYVYLGKSRSSIVEFDALNVFSGISLELNRRDLILKSGETVNIVLTMDVDNESLYSDLQLRLLLPDGLSLVNQTIDDYITIEGGIPESIVITLRGERPGPYEIDTIEVRYLFNDRVIEETLSVQLVVRVREDVTSTYMVWLAPGLVIAILFSILIRKRIVG